MDQSKLRNELSTAALPRSRSRIPQNRLCKRMIIAIASSLTTSSRTEFIEKVISQYHIVGVQETKFRDTHHLAKFNFHLSSISRHRLFVSDRNSSCPVPIGPRSCGVGTLLHPELPGVESAQEVASATIPGRYILVRLVQENRTVYIHNIYAPVRSTERAAFYQDLPTQLDPDAPHIVLGDFNAAVDPVLDSRGISSALDPSRRFLLV